MPGAPAGNDPADSLAMKYYCALNFNVGGKIAKNKTVERVAEVGVNFTVTKCDNVFLAQCVCSDHCACPLLLDISGPAVCSHPLFALCYTGRPPVARCIPVRARVQQNGLGLCCIWRCRRQQLLHHELGALHMLCVLCVLCVIVPVCIAFGQPQHFTTQLCVQPCAPAAPCLQL